MFNVLALSHEDTVKILDMENVIEKVEMAYRLKHEKQALLFPMIFHEFERGVADMDIKSGHLTGAGIFGLKLVSWFDENSKKNLPQLTGIVMVFDASTGAPKAILSAEHITCMRTGAAGAIGAKYLARQDSETLLIVGSGTQALYQVAATLMVMPSLKHVLVYNSRNSENAMKFRNALTELLKTHFIDTQDDSEKKAKFEKAFDVSFDVVTEISKDTAKADIIITATPSREALIMKSWVSPGTHFSCIGADMDGKQEIDAELLPAARLYTDDIHQSLDVGEAEKAYSLKLIDQRSYVGEIGAVIAGDLPGRLTEKDLTIFDSTGIALQDLIVANYAMEVAKARGIGSQFNL